MIAPVVAEHVFRPRGAARAVFECRDDEVLLAGPAGTGKSRAALEKVHMMMLLNPGARALLVRKTNKSLAATGLQTWKRFVIAEALQTGEVWYYGGSSEEPPQYRYRNGSRVVIGGMDNPDKIMSAEYDVVYVQEATDLNEDDWEKITSRLRNWRISFQQLIADCNPGPPHHWLKQRCDKGLTTMLHSRHRDNPELYDDDGNETERGKAYLDKLRRLTGVRRKRLYDGLWVAAEGVIYESWDDAIHHVDRFDIPPEWPRWWSVDFGYTNPFVCQWWAEDPDGRLYLYREIYRTRRLVRDHARAILAQVRRPRAGVTDPDWTRPDDWEWIEPRPQAVICDHDAEGRAQLEEYLGMATRPANKDVAVSEGIQLVEQRLVPAGDGRPRLALMRDSLVERDPDLEDSGLPMCTVEEIVGYVWDIRPDKPPKEDPVKENDHGMDAMRYMVVERDGRTRTGVRWVR
ncbi:MAG TPA: phage terminase large subunit [Woeseiaceae bacterium]